MDNNNKRLAKNSLIMYAQVMLSMFISFFVTRILLKTLGASDYGTYNVVGGFVATMSVVSGPMASGIQRFFAFDMGKEDDLQLTRDFNTTNLIYLMIAAICLLSLETIGLWFLNTQMTFENGRMDVVNWVYQLSVFTFICSVIAIPYNALILAHEEIHISSIFAITERVGLLIIVLSLSVIPYDHLKVYSLLCFILAVVINLLPLIYSKIRYKESRFMVYWDKSFFKSILTYSAYNTIGVLSGVGRTHGINILLNIFFGPVVNAARAVSSQLQNIVQTFYYNIFTPTRPQVTKYYARGEYDNMWTLMVRATKVMFYVCMIIALPLGLEAEYVLTLWLGEYPEFTPVFLRLSLIVSLCSSSSVLNCAVLQSANKIKREQILVATITLMALPLSYIVLKLGGGAVSPFIIAVILQFVSVIVDIKVVQYELKKNMKFFFVLLARLYLSLFVAALIPYVITFIMPSSLIRLICVIFICILTSTLSIYLLAFSNDERVMVKNFICVSVKKWCKEK